MYLGTGDVWVNETLDLLITAGATFGDSYILHLHFLGAGSTTETALRPAHFYDQRFLDRGKQRVY